MRDLHKYFGANEVLKGIDFHVDHGQVVCVIGPSGSGKSTLLRCVNRLEDPTSGTILVEGVDITDPETDLDDVRSRIGIVFQSFNLFPHMNVMRNLCIAQQRVRGRGQGRRPSRSRARTWPRSGSPARRTPTPPTSPVASSSAWPSPGPCRWTPT